MRETAGGPAARRVLGLGAGCVRGAGAARSCSTTWPTLANKATPAKVGNYPINDPKGFYLGQALAGYGLMWNTRYLTANKLPAPTQWADLVKPVYFGHVAMSSPSRSGTTHLTVETMLQGEGWDKGWSQLLQIAGNSAAITERSFGVPDGVNNGQFGVGLVIDFFGLAGKYSGFPVEFVYPDVTAVVPANIALVAGGKNTAEAKKFIAATPSRARRPGTAARPEDLAPADPAATRSWAARCRPATRTRSRSPSAPR